MKMIKVMMNEAMMHEGKGRKEEGNGRGNRGGKGTEGRMLGFEDGLKTGEESWTTKVAFVARGCEIGPERRNGWCSEFLQDDLQLFLCFVAQLVGDRDQVVVDESMQLRDVLGRELGRSRRTI